MKYLTRSIWVAALLCLVPVAARPLAAQSMTSITATNVRTGSGPVTGTLCLKAWDRYSRGITVSVSGGGLYTPEQATCQSLTAGALAGPLSVPNPLTDSMPHHGYNVIVYDSVHHLQTDLGLVNGIGGASWSLDEYIPTITVPVPASYTYTTGNGQPPSSCVMPAEDDRVNAGVVTQSFCFNGVFIATAGAAATVSIGTVTTGAPGSSAAIINQGTPSNAILNFTIPKGDTGATGPTGPSGAAGGVQVAGDLGGTAAAPKVIGFQGNPIDPTAPKAGQAIVGTSAGGWAPGYESCSGYACPNHNQVNAPFTTTEMHTLALNISTTSTSLQATTAFTGYPAQGCFAIRNEMICYTSIGTTTIANDTLLGLQRGVNSTLPGDQDSGPPIMGLVNTSSSCPTCSLAYAEPVGGGVWLGGVDTWVRPSRYTVVIPAGIDMVGNNIQANLFVGPSTGVLGVTEGNLADAGYGGELIQSCVPPGSAVSIPSAIGTNVTSVKLTPGDWDVEGNINFNGTSITASSSNLQGVGLNSVTNTLPTDGSVYIPALTVATTTMSWGATMPRQVYNVSTSTPVYAVAYATFSAGTVTAFGCITARRVH